MTVPRSCYYEWLDSPKTEREKANEKLIEILKVLFEKRRGTYGTRRLKNKLAEQGIVVSRRRIGQLMSQAGLWCKPRKNLKQRLTLNIISQLHLTYWKGGLLYQSLTAIMSVILPIFILRKAGYI